MKSRIPYAIAAALAAGAASVAFAQATPEMTPQPATESTPASSVTLPWTPNTEPVASNLTFVQEPVASLSRTEGADTEIAKSIADALNAEPLMKNAKITVQPDNGTITMTGVVPSRAAVKKAGEIAKQMAGDGVVVNAIIDSQS